MRWRDYYRQRERSKGWKEAVLEHLMAVSRMSLELTGCEMCLPVNKLLSLTDIRRNCWKTSSSVNGTAMPYFEPVQNSARG